MKVYLLEVARSEYEDESTNHDEWHRTLAEAKASRAEWARDYEWESHVEEDLAIYRYEVNRNLPLHQLVVCLLNGESWAKPGRIVCVVAPLTRPARLEGAESG